MTPKATYQWAFIKSNHPNSAKKYLFIQFNEQVQTALYEISKKGYCSFSDFHEIFEGFHFQRYSIEFDNFCKIRKEMPTNKKYSSKVFIRKFFQCFK